MNASDSPPGKDRIRAARAELLRRRIAGEATAPGPAGIPRQSREGPLPASHAQERLYFLWKLHPHSPAYHMTVAMRLRGPLDYKALQGALGATVAAHEALRTTFSLKGGRLEQVPGTSPDIAWHRQTLRAPHELGPAASEFANRPFDLHTGPLLRAALFEMGDEEAVVLLVLHHILSDEWSNTIILGDWAQAYSALMRGLPAATEPPAIQYIDYAAWERGRETGRLAEERDWWRACLDGAPPVSAWPADRVRAAEPEFRGRILQRRMSADLTGRVARLADQTGISPFMAGLGGFQVLLYWQTGQPDLLLGMPAANRGRPELESVVGLFLNSVVIRGHVDPEASFRQHLDQVRDRARGALAHQALPFEEVVASLGVERSANLNPLFQVMVVHEAADDQEWAFPGLETERLMLDMGVAKLDLTLFLRFEGDGLQVAVEYDTDLYREDTIERLLEGYEAVLESLTSRPAEPIRSALQLPEPAVRALLAQSRGPRPIEDPGLLTPERIASHADGVAILAGGQECDYPTLLARAGGVARSLRAQGVGAGDLVPVMCVPGTAQIVALLGAWRAGAAYVPVDTEWPAERRAAVLAALTDAPGSAGCLLTDGEVQPPPGYAGMVVDVRQAGEAADEPWAALSGDDPAYVIFTSGTTGTPNGVMVSHANLAASNAARFDVYGEVPRRFLLLSGYAFDSSVAGLFWTLAGGGTLVIATGDDRRDPRRIAQVLESAEVTHTLMLPQLWGLTLEAAEQGALDALRCVIVAGEACPAELPPRHRARLPGTRLFNEYGPTEATVWATVHPCSGEEAGLVPIGRPIPGMQALVMDANGALLPHGAEGELCLAGPGVTGGYLAAPERTAARFVPHPHEPGVRLYRTGDRVRLDHRGDLLFLGRMDRQVKVRGYRLEPGEVEAALLECPGVREACVDLEAGAEPPRLVAWLAGQEVPDAQELRARLSASLPAWMVPSAFVILPALPRGATGKLDRARLPSPDPARRDTAGRAGGGTRDGELAALWCRVLGVPEVRDSDHFFELGGHSLTGVSLMMEIERRFGVALPLAVLFEGPTFAELERALEEGGEREESTVLIPVRPQGTSNPVFCIHEGAQLLVDNLPEHLPVYLLFRHLAQVKDQAVSIESLAEEYLAAVRRVQPRGPYRLVGFSAGAQVAVQMAHGLAASGESVEWLALCEPTLPDSALFYRQRLRLARADISESRSLAAKLRQGLAMAWVSLRLRLERLRGRWQNMVYRRSRRASLWLGAGGLSTALLAAGLLLSGRTGGLGPLVAMAGLAGLLLAAVAAFRERRTIPESLVSWREIRMLRSLCDNYVQPTWDGDVVIFLPESERPNLAETRQFWRRYFTGRFSVLLVPGTRVHHDLVDAVTGAPIPLEILRLMEGAWPQDSREVAAPD